MILRPPAKPLDLSLYLVLGAADCDDPLHVVEAAIAGGVTVVQWREKTQIDIQLARGVMELCHTRRVPFILNDDVALAQQLGADGVHLGQDDMAPNLARDILGPEAIIGLSVGGEHELARLDPSCVDYVGVGPVYATRTKGDAGEALGLDTALEFVEQHIALPSVLIGGINTQRLTADTAVERLRGSGCGIAVVSAITSAASPALAAKNLRAVLSPH